jgi:hypothetical protein
VIEADERPNDILPAAYPLLVRSLSNLLIYVTPAQTGTEAHFVTLEQGYYSVPANGDAGAFFAEVYRRLLPLASSRLVINNIFEADNGGDRRYIYSTLLTPSLGTT